MFAKGDFLYPFFIYATEICVLQTNTLNLHNKFRSLKKMPHLGIKNSKP